MISEQTKTIRELEIVVRGYEDNLGEPLRAVREDVEKEWEGKVEEEKKKREEAQAWGEELVRALEKEKKVCFFALNGVFFLLSFMIQARVKLEEERRALAAFVSKFDSLGLGLSPTKINPPLPTAGGANTAFAERRQAINDGDASPVRMDMKGYKPQPSLLEEDWAGGGVEEMSFEMEKSSVGNDKLGGRKKNVLMDKENVFV